MDIVLSKKYKRFIAIFNTNMGIYIYIYIVDLY